MAEIRSSIISVSFPDGCIEKTIAGVYQYDHGLTLSIKGIETARVIQAQYTFEGLKQALTVTPITEDSTVQADIPDTVLAQPKEVRCYIYVEDDSSGLTVKEIHIPITPRAKPQSTSFTPQQIDNYNALIAQLNSVISQVTSEKEDLVGITSRAEQTVAEAQEIADNAEIITNKLSSVGLEVQMLPPSADPTSSVTQTENKTTFNLGIPTSNLAYATFEVDPQDGCQYMESPDGWSDVTFSLSEDGELQIIL